MFFFGSTLIYCCIKLHFNTGCDQAVSRFSNDDCVLHCNRVAVVYRDGEMKEWCLEYRKSHWKADEELDGNNKLVKIDKAIV